MHFKSQWRFFAGDSNSVESVLSFHYYIPGNRMGERLKRINLYLDMEK